MSKYLFVFALLFFCVIISASQGQETNFSVNLKQVSSDIPDSTNLSQGYPNPFCPTTALWFDIKEKTIAKINLYDDKMGFIGELLDEELKPGKYEIIWDAYSLKSGVYFFELIAGNTKNTKKIFLIK